MKLWDALHPRPDSMKKEGEEEKKEKKEGDEEKKEEWTLYLG